MGFVFWDLNFFREQIAHIDSIKGLFAVTEFAINLDWVAFLK